MKEWVTLRSNNTNFSHTVMITDFNLKLFVRNVFTVLDRAESTDKLADGEMDIHALALALVCMNRGGRTEYEQCLNGIEWMTSRGLLEEKMKSEQKSVRRSAEQKMRRMTEPKRSPGRKGYRPMRDIISEWKIATGIQEKVGN